MSNGETGPFCDNEKCQYHWKVVDETQSYLMIAKVEKAFSLTSYIPDSVTTHKVRRYRIHVAGEYYADSITGMPKVAWVERFVCENCYEVYKMLTGE